MIMDFVNAIFGSFMALTPVAAIKMVVMWAIGGILVYLAIKRDMEPALLLPMGFGAILVNLPFSGAITQIVDGVTEEGPLSVLFNAALPTSCSPCCCLLALAP